MINFIKSIILSLLFISCGTYIKYSDSLYSPVTRSGIYKPSGGYGSLMSDFQVDRAQSRWFNYYNLNMSYHYYNPYFSNNWYLSNRWRFDNYWRVNPFMHVYTPTASTPRYRFRPPVRKPTRVVPRTRRNSTTTVPTRTRPNNTRIRVPRNIKIAPERSRTSGPTIKIPSRINPNNQIRRTNANPTRQNTSNYRNSRSTNSRRQ